MENPDSRSWPVEPLPTREGQAAPGLGVTIGLPFFNCERTLLSAIRSIFAQTWQAWELILVDDGSTDTSCEIAARVRDPRVRLVADGENRGLVARLNQIAQMARFPYVCRMDGDDLSHPDRLAVQMAYLEAHPELDVLGTMAISIDAANRPRALRTGGPHFLRDARTMLRARGGALIHPSVMARAEWMRRFPYDPEFVRAEDMELWVRASTTSHLEQLPRVLYFYREDGAINLASYRKSCATSRKVVRRYGPDLLGPLETLALVARYHVAELCYRAFAKLGQAERLIARRGIPLSGDEVAQARATITHVVDTPVPGIEEPRA